MSICYIDSYWGMLLESLLYNGYSLKISKDSDGIIADIINKDGSVVHSFYYIDSNGMSYLASKLICHLSKIGIKEIENKKLEQ